jgi:hypothetical protein
VNTVMNLRVPYKHEISHVRLSVVSQSVVSGSTRLQ